MMTLIKKEWFELLKTKKILILPIITMFFAFTSPIVAKYMNELLSFVFKDELAMIDFPDTTYIDSYIQYFGNMQQILALILLFVVISAIMREKLKGQLVILFSKPVPRKAFIFAKTIVYSLYVMISLILGAIIAGFYTVMLFGTADIGNFILANSALLIFNLFFVVLAIFIATVFKSFLASISVGVGVYFAFMLAMIIDLPFYTFTPIRLLTLQTSLFTSEAGDLRAFLVSTIMTVILSIVLLFIAKIRLESEQF